MHPLEVNDLDIFHGHHERWVFRQVNQARLSRHQINYRFLWSPHKHQISVRHLKFKFKIALFSHLRHSLHKPLKPQILPDSQIMPSLLLLNLIIISPPPLLLALLLFPQIPTLLIELYITHPLLPDQIRPLQPEMNQNHHFILRRLKERMLHISEIHINSLPIPCSIPHSIRKRLQRADAPGRTLQSRPDDHIIHHDPLLLERNQFFRQDDGGILQFFLFFIFPIKLSKNEITSGDLVLNFETKRK